VGLPTHDENESDSQVKLQALLTVKEAARRLNLSAVRVHALIADGVLPAEWTSSPKGYGYRLAVKESDLGLAAARHTGGRGEKSLPIRMSAVRTMRKRGKSWQAIAAKAGVSVNTIRRRAKREGLIRK
jgi:excisionase family DNA binding protein